MLRMNWTEPSAKRKFEPPTCRLEKSSRPPSVSVVALLRWQCESTSADAGQDAAPLPGQGFIGPRRVTALGIAPAHVIVALDHALSPINRVWLVPSVMSVKRVRLLR